MVYFIFICSCPKNGSNCKCSENAMKKFYVRNNIEIRYFVFLIRSVRATRVFHKFHFFFLFFIVSVAASNLYRSIQPHWSNCKCNLAFVHKYSKQIKQLKINRMPTEPFESKNMYAAKTDKKRKSDEEWAFQMMTLGSMWTIKSKFSQINQRNQKGKTFFCF